MKNSIIKKYTVENVTDGGIRYFNTEFAAYEYIRSQNEYSAFKIETIYEVVNPDDLQFRATLLLTVYGAPARTLRAIQCCLEQDATGIEIIIFGDNCPHLAELISNGFFKEKIIEQQIKGNDLIVENLTVNHGGFGYHQRNLAKKMSRGNFFMYMDNDDVILKNHVSTRLLTAENGDYDLIGFETYIEPNFHYRDTDFTYGKIGHSEIVFRTDFLKSLPESTPEYGHDWTLVDNAINAGAKCFIKKGEPRTYIVKSLPSKKEIGID